MYFGHMYLNSAYLMLVVPAMLIALFAQLNVSSTFNRYSRVSSSGLTGAQAARAILDANGLSQVRLEQVRGNLTDHYDPRANVIRLSDSVYHSATVAAVGVAAHEAGHAVQYALNYPPIRVRNAIIPVTNFGSRLSVPLILIGFIFQMDPLVKIGIVLFACIAVFQLVTLPVEFNASSRAIAIIQRQNLLGGEQVQGARRVLGAAAMTYVAALLTSLAQLLYYITRFGGRRGSD